MAVSEAVAARPALSLMLFAPLPMTQAIGAVLIARLDYQTLYISTAAFQIVVVIVAVVQFRSRRNSNPFHQKEPERCRS
jgi:hypothetical protein